MHEKAAVGYEPLHTTPRAEVAHKGKDASTDTRQFSQNWSYVAHNEGVELFQCVRLFPSWLAEAFREPPSTGEVRSGR